MIGSVVAIAARRGAPHTGSPFCISDTPIACGRADGPGWQGRWRGGIALTPRRSCPSGTVPRRVRRRRGPRARRTRRGDRARAPPAYLHRNGRIALTQVCDARQRCCVEGVTHVATYRPAHVLCMTVTTSHVRYAPVWVTISLGCTELHQSADARRRCCVEGVTHACHLPSCACALHDRHHVSCALCSRLGHHLARLHGASAKRPGNPLGAIARRSNTNAPVVGVE